MTHPKYIIISGSPSKDQLGSSIQRRARHLRKSNDGTKCILKYRGTKPAAMGSRKVYTWKEIRRELLKPAWKNDEAL